MMPTLNPKLMNHLAFAKNYRADLALAWLTASDEQREFMLRELDSVDAIIRDYHKRVMNAETEKETEDRQEQEK